jgi:RNA polymerase subunit RPABC4/transcription elongation factor Spt4
MQDILNTIGSTIGGFFDNPVVHFAFQGMSVYIVILWLASAYWAFRDMQLRSENPVLPYLAAALIVLFTPVLFLFGVIVYRIVRPHEKIGEVYERNLAEEALLAEVEAVKTCPACHKRIHDEWIICPNCRTRLNRVCANCGRLVGLDWSLCAWCGRDFERGDIAAFEPISGGLGDLDRIEAPAARTTRIGTRGAPPRQAPRPASGGRSASGPASEP